jgi:3-oxoacyl-[acyl-carrier protein] reductase
VADLTKLTEIEGMCARIEETFGPIDVLVANAGGNRSRPGQPVDEIPEDAWRACIDDNLTATFLTLKAVLPGMKARRRGSIITISSAAARRPHSGSPIPYAVAKAGIELLTQDVALHAGPYDVRVNCIAPETILTDRNQQQIPEAMKKKMAEDHAIRRLGTPEDVARTALFLASEIEGWITGVVIDVAGGSVLVR